MYCWDKILFDSSLSSSSALHQAVKKMEQLVSSSMGFTRFLERNAFLPARRKSVFKREVESKTDCCSKERPKWRVASVPASRLPDCTCTDGTLRMAL